MFGRREFAQSLLTTPFLTWLSPKLPQETEIPFIDKSNCTCVIKELDGIISHYKDGKLHRDGDKPAVIRADGSVSYYKDGKLHRNKGRWVCFLLERWQTSP